MNGAKNGTTEFISTMKNTHKKQKLYHHTHNVTGKKYLGQTTRDLSVYKGSSVDWLEHLKEYGDDYTTEVLFESNDPEQFKQVCKQYSEKFDVVNNPEYFNLCSEYGGSLGDKANPNYKNGKYTGRLDDPELYKALDAQAHKEKWPTGRKQACPRMLFNYYKWQGRKKEAEHWWNIWYAERKKTGFKAKQRKALWETDTFEMWYSRQGNELDFRLNI